MQKPVQKIHGNNGNSKNGNGKLDNEKKTFSRCPFTFYYAKPYYLVLMETIMLF